MPPFAARRVSLAATHVATRFAKRRQHSACTPAWRCRSRIARAATSIAGPTSGWFSPSSARFARRAAACSHTPGVRSKFANACSVWSMTPVLATLLCKEGAHAGGRGQW